MEGVPKVLIVEDDAFVSRSYKAGFEKEGFEVLVAFDGMEALEVIHQKAPDIVLLDLIMPKQNGFEVLEALSVGGVMPMPVIVSSNLSQASDIEQAKALGAVDYINKSDSTLKQVVEKVRSYLK